MKTKHEFIKKYLEAKLREQSLEDRISKLFTELNPDNYLVSLQSSGSSYLLDDLMNEVCGVELMDWVFWWMYECEHGTKHYEFTINGREYVVSKLTLQQFLEVVDASN